MRRRRGSAATFFKSLAVSFVLSPTLFLIGWFAFPAPATLVLLSHLLSLKHEPYEYEDMNLFVAGVSFLVTTAFVYAYLNKRQKDDGKPALNFWSSK